MKDYGVRIIKDTGPDDIQKGLSHDDAIRLAAWHNMHGELARITYYNPQPPKGIN